MNEFEWSKWQQMPNPANHGKSLPRILKEMISYFDQPGVYQLQNHKTGQYVLFGESVELAKRMGSLIPKEHGGVGRRNNFRKRDYVWENLSDIHFRTLKCRSKAQAQMIENEIKQQYLYIFDT